MRTIKFRAWDSKVNKMIYAGQCLSESDSYGEWDIYLSIGLDGILYAQVNDDGGKGGLWEHNYSLEKNRLMLQQFTGLHDKNGKEIYEGDILTRSRMIFSVHFGTSAFGVSLHSGGKSFASNWDLVGGREEGEIIGNIHENPELLR